MIYNKQLVFPHRPETDEWGDCFRTCLACMLDLPTPSVPHFLDKGQTGDDFWLPLQKWMSDAGLYLLTLPYEGETSLEDVLKAIGGLNPGNRYMLSGMSPRETNHVVVCLDNEIEWDPSPPGGDLVGPCDDGNWWVEFIGRKV